MKILGIIAMKIHITNVMHTVTATHTGNIILTLTVTKIITTGIIRLLTIQDIRAI